MASDSPDHPQSPAPPHTPGSAGLSALWTRGRRPRARERPEGLPPWRRLRSTRDFARVERQGARVSGDVLAVTVRHGPGRVGFVVSKKVDGRAAVRNLVKRRLREIARTEKARYAGVVDVVITARPAAKDATFAALRALVIEGLTAALARLKSAPPRRR